jgi:hypothetical protein
LIELLGCHVGRRNKVIDTFLGGGEGVHVVFCTKNPFFMALSMGKDLLENVES